MKKIVALLPVLLAGCIVFANINDNLPANLNSAFSLRAKNNSSLQVNFTLPEYTIQEEANGGPAYRKIILPLSGTLMETGMPELPVVCTTIAIPHTGGVNIEVLSTQQTIIPDFLPYPVQQGNSLESPKGFIINNTYYSGGCNYPEMLIEYSEPSILRDFRIITIQINPFSYNAQSGELTVNHNIEFSINFTEEQGINELTNEPTRISASFDKIYESIILNYDDYRDALVANTPPRYLMIYGTNSDTNFATALNEFVLWKKQKGADVMVASTAANEAGNTTTSIKNYIQTKYNNPETRPDFIVLIGDTSGSYAIPYFTQSNGATDYNYTFLAGTDQLGDCFIGRISVENLSQLLAVLNKIYLYERDINLDTASWLNKMMLSGDNAPSGISTMYIHKYIKEMSLLTNPDYTFTEDYGSSPNYTIINQALN
ncbi:MAG TPA: C25 family cysteine peptidase, partial [Candidatus Cloacimonas sp.]|nr:C25 family cysteine peptidase [Candidatus Cloacimonas sp.]